MKELSLFFRTHSEMIAEQCFTRLKEAKKIHPGDRENCLAVALTLLSALAESLKEDDPEVFIRSLDPYLKKGPSRSTTPYLPDIIAAIEEEAMARDCPVAEMHFLWSLFSRAGKVMLKSSVTGLPDTKKPKDSEIETAETTLLKLQKEIDERKRVEKELRESERRFRELAESMPQVIFEVDEKGTINFVNKQAFEFFGYKEDDFSGEINCFAHIAPEEFPRMMANLQKAAEGVPSTGNEYKAIKKDGSLFPVSIHVTRIMKDGRLAGYRGIIIDITERVKIEEELTQSKRFLQGIADNIPGVIFQFYVRANDEMGISYLSGSSKELFGIDVDSPDAFGQFLQGLTSSCRERFLDSVMEVIRKECGWEFEGEFRKPSGEIISFVGMSSPVKNGDTFIFNGVLLDITKRKQIEEELREEERKFRDVAELTPQVIFELAADGKITFVNKQGLELFGYTEEEIRNGVSAYDLFPGPERNAARENIRKTIAGERGTKGYEYTVQRKDGGTFPVIIYTTAIFKDGQPAGFRGVLVDITELKSAEEKLLEREQRFRDLAESMPQIIFEMDENGRLTFANRQAFEIYGYSHEEFLAGIDGLSLIAPKDLPRIKEGLRKIAEGGPPTGNEYTAIRKDGSLFPISTHVVRIMKDGRLAGYRGIIIDITEKRKSEEELIKGERRLRQIIDLVPHFIFAKDIDGRFILVNKAVADAYGTTVEGLTGKTDAQFNPSDKEVDHFIKDDMEVIKTGTSKYIPEESITDSQGRQRYLQTVKIPFTFSGTRTPAVLGVSVDITENKQAQEALRKSEERFRKYFEIPLIGVAITSLEGKWLEVNDKFCDMTGYRREELATMTWQDITPPEELQEELASYESFMRDSADLVSTREKRYIRKGGSLIDVILSTHCVRKSDGSPDYRMSIIQDITERKINERKIIESEQVLSATLAASPIGICRVRNRIVEWSNEAMQAISGYSTEELAKTTSRLLYESDSEFERAGEVLYREGRVETKWVRKDGEPRYILLQTSPTDSYAYIVTASDITEHKRAEEALGISESRLRAIIESAKDSIFIKDKDHIYILANNAMSKLFGIPVDEIIGKHDRELFGSEEAVSHIEMVDNKVLRGETIEEERPRPIGDIIHTFHTIKVPLRNENGEIVGLCGIARDITERKHLESQLLHSQKMEAVGTLAGGVAHDFNNLLSAIMGYSSLLQMKMSGDDPLKSYVSHILTSSEKAANLTQSLLAFSRKQVINLKPISINDTVEKLHRLLRRLITEDVEFRIENTHERLISMCDINQIDQVIMNLVTNARDAMPRGGKLTLSVGRAAIDNEFIMTHGYGRVGEYAVINVTDTGTGMDEKTAQKIFEPFFTTKEVGRGTGLGLSIVYGIVKQHNGFIEVKSSPGAGSTFLIYLPLVWLEPAHEEIVDEAGGGTETILIAEDNDELRDLSINVLTEKGYTVLQAKDGVEAVRIFMEHRNEISLAILDVVMPKMNGREAYEEIIKTEPFLRVIFTSGYTDDIIQRKGVDDTFDFLGKPITPNALLKKIREVLDKKKPC